MSIEGFTDEEWDRVRDFCNEAIVEARSEFGASQETRDALEHDHAQGITVDRNPDQPNPFQNPTPFRLEFRNGRWQLTWRGRKLAEVPREVIEGHTGP
ncbi:hypothetical protein [Saccharothrix deserti]|uniref:hypothetical protein n=1 Tax=Saccharothrix deserti TaxID=2593674 RepID=UPI00131AD9E2|nr:hypothetical protein [Saccharothrix deserti]